MQAKRNIGLYPDQVKELHVAHGQPALRTRDAQEQLSIHHLIVDFKMLSNFATPFSSWYVTLDRCMVYLVRQINSPFVSLLMQYKIHTVCNTY